MENTSKELARLIELGDDHDFQVAAAGSSLAEGGLILAGQGTVARSLPAPVDIEGLTLGRAIDVVVALGLIIVLLPVMVMMWLAVKFTSSGPAVFQQERIGRNGKIFKCNKFRSMYDGAEQILARLLREDPALAVEWQTLQKLKNDPRVTPIGRILRATSLDELPQLFNILKGEMALVGPRPVSEVELRVRTGRYRASYLSVRPGLTGLWQVSGRSSISYRRRVAIDHLYVRRKCLALDLRILVATVPAVIMQRGAC